MLRRQQLPRRPIDVEIETHLVELVDSRGDGAGRGLRNTAKKEDPVQDLSVVDLLVESG